MQAAEGGVMAALISEASDEARRPDQLPHLVVDVLLGLGNAAGPPFLCSVLAVNDRQLRLWRVGPAKVWQSDRSL